MSKQTKSEMIDELLATMLIRYNEDKKDNPVSSNDTYYKSFLIGFLTWSLTEKQLKESLDYYKEKN